MGKTTTFLTFAATSLAALALAGCSGKASEDTAIAAPSEEASMAPVEATEAAMPVATGSAAVTPSESATPDPAPTPKASETPEAKPSKAATAAAAAPIAVAAVAPPASFARCAVCHNAEKSAGSKIGPNLWGVYGTKAGDIKGYSFSDALKASGLTWNDATLDKWIAGPMQMVPGTMMSFPGIKDPAKRAEIIAFLKAAR